MMGKHKVLISGIAVAVIGAFVVFAMPEWLAQRGAAKAKDVREDKAPDFVLKDIQGGKFRLNDQRGKPVLLIFGTTWCPSCRDEIPHLKDIYARYAKKGLIMVNIDIQESRDKVSRYADKYELPYRVLLDENGDLAQTYGIRGVPTLILLDEEGMIAGGQRFIDPLLATMLKGKKL
ncbi:MAG: TlpA disulfide reductase family protein [Syntrophales bacterium]|nr:TlpA disulfide reductase family protein [Syntrophales bacterium]